MQNTFYSNWYTPAVDACIVTGSTAWNLFSRDTLKVLGLAIPAYGLFRKCDERIQNNFFCHETKKHINQLPSPLYHLIHEGFIVFAVGITGFGVFKSIQQNRQWYCDTVGGVTLMLLIWGTKSFFKSFEHDGCLRPHHEKLAPINRAYGGLPSGHMSMISSLATYWWGKRGPAFGIPLTLTAIATAVSLVNVNRHYCSQIIAGAGWGIIMGMAANKAATFLKNKYDDIECNISYDIQKKETSFALECTF